MTSRFTRTIEQQRWHKTTADIGLIGLAVMGENLVLNMESRGYTVAVFNRTTAKVDEFVQGRGQGKNLIGCHDVKELIAALKRPRKIMIMVKAGTAVDAVIDRPGAAAWNRATSSSMAATPTTPTPPGGPASSRKRACSSSAPASPAAKKGR